MSTIKVDTLVAADGSSAVTLTKQSAAKAWVNFNGTGTIAARDSFNLSSLTDNGTGDYRVSISNSMSNSSYATPCSGGSTTGGRYNIIAESDGKAVGSADFFGFQTSTGSALDNEEVSTCFHGDLA